jgi:hypothetical protein
VTCLERLAQPLLIAVALPRGDDLGIDRAADPSTADPISDSGIAQGTFNN